MRQTDPGVWVQVFRETRSRTWAPWEALQGCLRDSQDAQQVLERFLNEAFDYELTSYVTSAVGFGMRNCPDDSEGLMEWYQNQLMRWAAEGESLIILMAPILVFHVPMEEAFLRRLMFTPGVSPDTPPALMRKMVASGHPNAVETYLTAVREGLLPIGTRVAVSSMLENRLGAERLLQRLTDAVRRDPSLAGDDVSVSWASALTRPEDASPAAPGAREFLRQVMHAEQQRPGTVSKASMERIRRAGVGGGG